MSDDNVGMLKRWSKTIVDPMCRGILLNSAIEILTLRKSIKELKKQLREKK